MMWRRFVLLKGSHLVGSVVLTSYQYSNLAILYFYQSEFKKGLTLLEECLESMKDYQRFKQNLSESASSLMVKILVITKTFLCINTVSYVSKGKSLSHVTVYEQLRKS